MGNGFVGWFSRSAKVIIVGLVAFGTVMLVVIAFQHVEESRPAAGATPGPIPTFGSQQTAAFKLPDNPRTLIVGDSYTAGYMATNPATDNWARQAANKLGWNATIDGVQGSGYTVDGQQPDSKFSERIASHAGESYDLVVIQGSQNDSKTAERDLVSAASAAQDEAQKQWPNAVVVSIGPSAPLPAGAAYSPVNSALQVAAAKSSVTYINPAGEHWLTTQNSAQYAASDGEHLNSAGYAFMADKVAADFKRLQGTAKTAG